MLLAPETPPPQFAVRTPFRAVVIVEQTVTREWQASVCDWLVRSGCLYMMAWGLDCSSWDDSVDVANLEPFDFGEIPDDQFVMTTWHADESLQEVFRFAKDCAFHPTVELGHTLLVHVSGTAREKQLLQAYNES